MTLKDVFKIVLKRPLYVVGWLIVLVNFGLIFLAPVLAPYGPETADPSARLLPPRLTHWFGTDVNGMDIWSRVLHAPRVDLSIAFLGSLVALAMGAPLGAISAYYRGRASGIILRLADVVQAFPVFALAMALVAATGQNISNIIFVIAFVHAPIYLRLVRSRALFIRDRSFIEAARCIGHSDWGIIWRYLLPNSMAPAMVQASVNMGWAILLTAGLSFVGAGVRVPTPELGSMINIGAQNMITGEWWMSFFPGAALGVTVLGFSLVGDSLREILDPTIR